MKTGFLESLIELTKTYPWQIAGVTLAVLTILMNVNSTKSLVRALEMKRGSGRR